MHQRFVERRDGPLVSHHEKLYRPGSLSELLSSTRFSVMKPAHAQPNTTTKFNLFERDTN